MADTTVEIFKGTITPASIGSGNTSQTLVTTDASTRYVIRDVNVGTSTFPSAATPYLAVSDFNTGASLTSGAKFSGTEIVDVSSTIKAAFSSLNMSVYSMSYPTTTGPTYVRIGSSARTINGSIDSVSDVSQTNVTYADAHTFGYYTAPNGDCFLAYDDWNSAQQIRKYAGGWSGTRTDIMNNNYTPVAYAGNGVYYWLASNRVYKYDASTATQTFVATTAWMPTSSYPRLVFANGLLFSYPGTGYSSVLSIINPATGNVASLTGGALISVGTAGTAFTAHYDTTTGVVNLYWRDATYLMRVTLSTPVAVPTSDTTVSGAGTYSQKEISALGIYSGYNSLYAPTASIIVSANTSYQISAWSTSGSPSDWNRTSTLTTTAYGSSYKFDFVGAPATSGQLASFTSAIPLRITGVKSV